MDAHDSRSFSEELAVYRQSYATVHDRRWAEQAQLLYDIATQLGGMPRKKQAPRELIRWARNQRHRNLRDIAGTERTRASRARRDLLRAAVLEAIPGWHWDRS